MNKKYYILIAILIAYFLIIFLIFGLDNLKLEQRTATIFIDKETAWSLEKNKWNKIEIDNEKISNQKFNVFINNENIGNFYLEKKENWFLYDTSRNPYNYELGNFFAIRANYDVNVLNIKEQNISDINFIKKVLNDNGITESEELTVASQYEFDIDNDGVKEVFYAVGNAFSRETSPSKVFSIVFMKKDKEMYYLHKEIEMNDGQNGCKPYINTVIDLDSDFKYEIIVSCGYYSIQNRSDKLYTFKNNEFQLLASNE